MNIQEAQTILQAAVSQKKGEMDIFALALSVLTDKFSPDLTVLKAAQDDADAQRIIATNMKKEKDQATADLTAKIHASEAEVSRLNERLGAEERDHAADIATRDEEITTLKTEAQRQSDVPAAEVAPEDK